MYMYVILNKLHRYVLLLILHQRQVIWQKMFKSSSKDHGTLWHLCSLLGRLPSVKDPKKDMNACTDVLFTVLKAHYVAAACKELGIESPNSPLPETLPDFRRMAARERYSFIMKLSTQVLERCGVIEEALIGATVHDIKDGVQNYARVFCHHATLALEFTDAWSMGAGPRICRCWKFMMLHFQSTGHTKYAWEALRQQFQLVTLPPHLSYQLMWGRFINTRGGIGKNIPCDLHNEHLNKLFKEIFNNMGANTSEAAITRAARSVTALQEVTTNFDKETRVPVTSSAHSTLDDIKDVNTVVSVIIKKKIFDTQKGRMHTSFKNFSSNPLHNLNQEKILHWIASKQKQMIRYKYAVGEDNSEASDIESDDDSYEDIETEILSFI